MTDSNFKANVGPPDIHDATVISVAPSDDQVVVEIKAYEGI